MAPTSEAGGEDSILIKLDGDSDEEGTPPPRRPVDAGQRGSRQQLPPVEKSNQVRKAALEMQMQLMRQAIRDIEAKKKSVRASAAAASLPQKGKLAPSDPVPAAKEGPGSIQPLLPAAKALLRQPATSAAAQVGPLRKETSVVKPSPGISGPSTLPAKGLQGVAKSPGLRLSGSLAAKVDTSQKRRREETPPAVTVKPTASSSPAADGLHSHTYVLNPSDDQVATAAKDPKSAVGVASSENAVDIRRTTFSLRDANEGTQMIRMKMVRRMLMQQLFDIEDSIRKEKGSSRESFARESSGEHVLSEERSERQRKRRAKLQSLISVTISEKRQRVMASSAELAEINKEGFTKTLQSEVIPDREAIAPNTNDGGRLDDAIDMETESIDGDDDRADNTGTSARVVLDRIDRLVQNLEQAEDGRDVSIAIIPGEYSKAYGSKLNYRELGYKKLISLIRSVPGIRLLQKDRAWIIQGKASEASTRLVEGTVEKSLENMADCDRDLERISDGETGNEALLTDKSCKQDEVSPTPEAAAISGLHKEGVGEFEESNTKCADTEVLTESKVEEGRRKLEGNLHGKERETLQQSEGENINLVAVHELEDPTMASMPEQGTRTGDADPASKAVTGHREETPLDDAIAPGHLCDVRDTPIIDTEGASGVTTPVIIDCTSEEDQAVDTLENAEPKESESTEKRDDPGEQSHVAKKATRSTTGTRANKNRISHAEKLEGRICLNRTPETWRSSSDLMGYVFGSTLPRKLFGSKSSEAPNVSYPDPSTANGDIEYVESCLRQFRAYRLLPQVASGNKCAIMSNSVSHRIHPDAPVCSFDTRGSCMDKRCPFQHIKQYTLSESGALNYLFHHVKRSTGIELPRIADDVNSALYIERRAEGIVERARRAVGGRLRIPLAIDDADIEARSTSSFIFDKGDSHTEGYHLCTGAAHDRKKSAYDNPFLSQVTTQREGMETPLRLEDSPAMRFSGGEEVAREKSSFSPREIPAMINSCTSGEDCLSLFCRKFDLKLIQTKKQIELALAFLSKALESYPQSKPTWIVYLHLYKRISSRENVRTVVNLALTHNSHEPLMRILACDHEDTLMAKLRICKQSIFDLSKRQERSSSSKSCFALDYVLHAMHYMCNSGHAEELRMWLNTAALVSLGREDEINSIALPVQLGWELSVKETRELLVMLEPPEMCMFWLSGLYILHYHSLCYEVEMSLRYKQRTKVLPWPAKASWENTSEISLVLRAGDMYLKSGTVNVCKEISRIREVWYGNLFGLAASVEESFDTLKEHQMEALCSSPWLVFLHCQPRSVWKGSFADVNPRHVIDSFSGHGWLTDTCQIVEASNPKGHQAARILAKTLWAFDSRDAALQSLVDAFDLQGSQIDEEKAEGNLRKYIHGMLRACEEDSLRMEWILDLILLESLCDLESAIPSITSLIRLKGKILRPEILEACWGDLLAHSTMRLRGKSIHGVSESRKLLLSAVKECDYSCPTREYLYGVSPDIRDGELRVWVAAIEDATKKPLIDVGISFVDAVSAAYDIEGASAAVEAVVESSTLCTWEVLTHALIVNGFKNGTRVVSSVVDKSPWLTSLMIRWAEGACLREKWRGYAYAALLCAESGRHAAVAELCSLVVKHSQLCVKAFAFAYECLRVCNLKAEAYQIVRQAEGLGVRAAAISDG